MSSEGQIARKESEMKNCELMQKCIFFTDKTKNMPDAAEIIKKKYCQGDKNICARYKIAISFGQKEVPVNLFPRELKKANAIISDMLLSKNGFS
jgi:hypothetical protein